jgi:hypothetical protein
VKGIAIERPSGSDLHDNGVYVSSGADCTVIGFQFDRVGGMGVKTRGVRNVIRNGEIANVRNGISQTGVGTDLDSTGANGHSNACEAVTVSGYTGFAYTIAQLTRSGTRTRDLYQRDAKLSGCRAFDGCIDGHGGALRFLMTSGGLVEDFEIRGFDRSGKGSAFAALIGGPSAQLTAEGLVIERLSARDVSGVRRVVQLQYLRDGRVARVSAEHVDGALVELVRGVSDCVFERISNTAGVAVEAASNTGNTGNAILDGVGATS